MGLSEFPDALSPVTLHFGDNIGNESFCVEMSLIRHSQFPLLRPPSYHRLYLHSRQDLVMVDLFNNFLNLLKLFLTVASDCMKSLP
jgi:hypothetical protein